MTRALGTVVAGTLAVWTLSAVPVFLVGGSQAMLTSAVAGLVCLLPGAATLALGLWSSTRDFRWQMVAILGGMGMRMVAVLAAALVLLLGVPWFVEQRALFLILLVLYYLANVAAESYLLLQRYRPRRPISTQRIRHGC